MHFGQLAAVHAPWFPKSSVSALEQMEPPVVWKVSMAGDLAYKRHAVVTARVHFVLRIFIEEDVLAIGDHDPDTQPIAIAGANRRIVGCCPVRTESGLGSHMNGSLAE